MARAHGRALLAWYRANRRALPWRERVSPYAVLVSEVMLQQTRVETVHSLLPTIPRRVSRRGRARGARRSTRCSRCGRASATTRARDDCTRPRAPIVERGELPRTAAELLELPGVGAYTAAAVASIAFGEPVAVVDGNVERVIARLLALEVDPARSEARRVVRETASALLGGSRARRLQSGADGARRDDLSAARAPLSRLPAGRRLRRARERTRRGAAGARAATSRRLRAARGRGGAARQIATCWCATTSESELLAGVWEFPWTAKVGAARRVGGRARALVRWRVAARARAWQRAPRHHVPLARARGARRRGRVRTPTRWPKAVTARRARLVLARADRHGAHHLDGAQGPRLPRRRDVELGSLRVSLARRHAVRRSRSGARVLAPGSRPSIDAHVLRQQALGRRLDRVASTPIPRARDGRRRPTARPRGGTTRRTPARRARRRLRAWTRAALPLLRRAGPPARDRRPRAPRTRDGA